MCMPCVWIEGRGGLGYVIDARPSAHHAMLEACYGDEGGGWGALAKFGTLGTWGVRVYQLS